MISTIKRLLVSGLSITGAVVLSVATDSPGATNALDDFFSGQFRWTLGTPLLSAAERPNDPCISIKDPSIVYFGNRWHLFATIRSKVRTHQIEYCTFADWKEANSAQRHILRVTDGYFCAPQVFRFSKDNLWYLVYQASDESKSAIQPVYSTTKNIADPGSWSPPRPMYSQKPKNVKNWIDFWVICDDQKAHLFFTSLDGRMWRAETELRNFPVGWSEPGIVLEADIFEAAHVYRLKGLNKYLALIEAQAEGRRYYKAFLSDSLAAGKWEPLAATREKPFAGPTNVRQPSQHWTDSFSHGELFRDGCDEKLVVDPARLQFLIQGVSDQRKEGKAYGEIPWELGILQIANDK